MKLITFSALAIVMSWSVWVWVRFPAPKTPNDKQIIATLTARFEKEKQEAYNEGYNWCLSQPNPDLSKLNPL